MHKKSSFSSKLRSHAAAAIGITLAVFTISCEDQFTFKPRASSSTASSCTYSTGSCPHTVSAWATRDTYTYAGGNTASGLAFNKDAAANLYTVGVSNDAVANRWVVRQSTDAGVSWGAVEFDDYQLVANNAAQANAIAVDSSDNLYVVGFANDATANRWIVRNYPAGAGPWATLNNFQYANNQASQANAIVIDSSDYFYVGGQGSDGATTHWIVRKSINSGTTWSFVDDFQYSANQNAVLQGMYRYSSDGSIWALGYANDGTANRWIVRKSTNNGTSWSTVDDYQYETNQNAKAYAAAIDSCGYVYVVGEAVDSSANTRWIVRKSTDGGTSWTTVDDYVYTGGTSSSARSIAIESTGVLWVAGVGSDGANNRWVVRTSAAGGASFSNSDDFQNTALLDSSGISVGTTAAGSIFVTGQGTSAGPVANWQTRELGCL